MPAARTCKAAVQNGLASSHAPAGYDPFTAQMAHGAGRGPVHRLRPVRGGVQAENSVPEGYLRTWIERYVITKPEAGSGEDARRNFCGFNRTAESEGFKPSLIPKEDILKSFFVPKTLQPLRALALHAGLPGRRHLRRPGRRGAGGQELLHRLRFLHPGLPLRMPLFQSGNAHRRQVHPVLPSDHARSQAGVRGDLPVAGPDFRRPEKPRARTIRCNNSSPTTRWRN